MTLAALAEVERLRTALAEIAAGHDGSVCEIAERALEELG